ncbi:hypothetical protein C7B62_03165 [Pleurocapsa sp. CCALA 161]|uniref:tetratricopeptide repeat protein n=1 Tax=Pleurocapsa sp. CCALA 161 TaxID=2107688 RepID=UPI000D081F02|nr:tetratricopeptide repeat protein [Pleurocapsa sp. CCALA 161]PSB12069.1 hypothetical protein C7B62_03165 [Pleurocapsa sp. CCALA 161]
MIFVIKKASADFNRAIEIEPNNVDVCRIRGRSYDQQGKSELAIASYIQAIEIDPNYAKAYKSCGVSYDKLDKDELARTNLEKARQLYLAQGNAGRALAAEVDLMLKKLLENFIDFKEFPFK